MKSSEQHTLVNSEVRGDDYGGMCRTEEEEIHIGELVVLGMCPRSPIYHNRRTPPPCFSGHKEVWVWPPELQWGTNGWEKNRSIGQATQILRLTSIYPEVNKPSSKLSFSQSCLPPMCLLYWCPVSNLRPCLAKIYCGPSYHRTLPPRLRLAHWLTCPAVLPYSGLNLTMLQTSAAAPLQIWPTGLSSVGFQLHSFRVKFPSMSLVLPLLVSPCVL